MLFEYTYLLKDFDAAFFTGGNGPASDFIIPVNGEITSKKSALFKTLIQSGNRFCLYLPADLTRRNSQYVKEEIIQNIVRLLFLPNYLREQGKPIFFIESPADKSGDTNKLANEFYLELTKQGIREIIMEGLPPEPPVENTPNDNSISFIPAVLNDYLIAESNAEDCFETFTRKFVFPENFQKKWIVPVADPDSFAHTQVLIKKFESWLDTTQPQTVQLIKMYNQASRNGSLLETENKMLKFKLETSSYSLKLMRGESLGYVTEVDNLRDEIVRLSRQINNPELFVPVQAPPVQTDNDEIILQLRTQVDIEHQRGNAILDWYKKEYEVLPGWYKKFGHIIKAMIGKRTFKSLYK